MKRALRAAALLVAAVAGYAVLRPPRSRDAAPAAATAPAAAGAPVAAAVGAPSVIGAGTSRLPALALGTGAGIAVLAVTAGVLSGSKLGPALAPLAAIVALAVAVHRRLFRWDTLVSLMVATIFLIPIKRYTVPGNAFNLEPYRLFLALLAAAWWASVMVDRRVRLRRSGLEAPIVVFVFAILASDAVNNGRIGALGIQKDVVKTLTFFASFFILFYLIVSVIRTHAELLKIVRWLVRCATIVGFSALIESRTHFNVFNHLHPLLPGLQYNDPALTAGLTDSYLDRSGIIRVYASSAHPIELSAVMVMTIPMSVYLIKATGQRRWIFSILAASLASLATLSRTGIIMMFVTGLVYLWLRPVETRRLWPMVIPVFLAVSIALPHAIGSFYAAFFPKGGIVAEQSEKNVGSDNGGRLTDIGPTIGIWSQKPLLGEGFGSNITQRVGVVNSIKTTGRILDDQWLGTLLETGIVGVVGLLWLLVRTIRRLARRAKEDDGPEGWLALGLAASLYSFAVAMITFDAFGFIQVTLLTFIVLALSASLLKTPPSGAEPAAR